MLYSTIYDSIQRFKGVLHLLPPPPKFESFVIYLKINRPIGEKTHMGKKSSQNYQHPFAKYRPSYASDSKLSKELTEKEHQNLGRPSGSCVIDPNNILIVLIITLK